MVDGVLVVKVGNVDVAYLFMRQCLIAQLKLQREYQSRITQIQVGEQVREELRDSVNNGDLDAVVASVPQDSDTIDILVNNAVEYFRMFSGKVKKTDHIRGQIAKLISDHIGVIRAKLEPKATS